MAVHGTVIKYQGKYYIECPECGIRNSIKLSLYRSSHYCQYCKTLLVIEPGINELTEEDEWRRVPNGIETGDH